MKLPSLNEIINSTTEVLKRFPLVITSAAIFAFFLWTLIDRVDLVSVGACFAAVLGLSLFMGIDLLSERTGSKVLRWALSGLGIVALIIYAVVVGDKPKDNLVAVYQFGLLLLASHLFVSIAAFIRAGGLYAFWEFNKTLFLRFLLSALFSGVLFGGLAVAILAVDQLLLGGGAIEEQTYAKLFVLIGSLFNTIFFLAGVPKDFARLEEEREYPKGLKIFAQNLLLPLVVLYMSILYIYAASILLKWEWPQGWIGWLVLSFSVLGILALLLLHPLQKREEFGWMRRFTRWFYVAVLPLIGLLFAAIIRRISEYGITENRYFVILLAFWLAGMALYFLFSRRKNIKIIPLSLCIAALLSTYGPWSAVSVSSASQAGRFEGLVEKNSLLTDGKVDPEKGKKVSEDDKGEMRSILDYLGERDELDRIADVLPDSLAHKDHGYSIAAELGFGIDGVGAGIPFSYSSSWTGGRGNIGVKGFDLLVRSEQYFSWSEEEKKEFRQIDSVNYEGRQYRLLLRAANPMVVVVQGSDTVMRFDLAPVLAQHIGQEDTTQMNAVPPAPSVPDEDGVYEATAVEYTGAQGPDLIVEGTGGTALGQLRITSVNGVYDDDSQLQPVPAEISVNGISLILLLGNLSNEVRSVK